MHRGVYTCASTAGKAICKGFDPAKAMSLLRQASIVVLDVDSTIIRKEGIDMLASFLHKEDDILSLKKGISKGEIHYTKFTERSLNILRPSRKICEDCLKAFPYDLCDGAKEFIDACKSVQKEVYLLSGGYVPMITPLLEILDLPLSHLFAIPILFDSRGEYNGYDKTSDSTKLDGKGIIISKLRASLPNQNAVVVNIGDGILDAMAYPYSDAFIGYTGVTTKPRAMEQAMLIVDNFSELTRVISSSN